MDSDNGSRKRRLPVTGPTIRFTRGKADPGAYPSLIAPVPLRDLTNDDEQGGPRTEEEPQDDLSPLAVCSPPVDVTSMATKLAQVRTLLHEYTAGDTEEREKSVESLEKLTGYVTTAPLETLPPSPPDAPNDDERYELWTSLCPTLKQMDRAKNTFTGAMQNWTECKVIKCPRNGQVHYEHVQSGRAVDACEYEEKYLTALEQITTERNRAWKTYFDKLEVCSRVFVGEKKRGDDVLLSSPTAAQEELDTTELNAEQGGGDEVTSVKEVAQEEMELLPFPNRHEECSDPEIAQTEKRLWASIDAALEVYSAEVVAIRQQRQLEAKKK